MKKAAGLLYGVAAGLAALTFALTVSFPATASAHSYTGESKCEDCHDAKHEALNVTDAHGKKTDPITAWQSDDPHHKTADALTSDWGKQAAAKAKVADPTAEGSMCLSCHATGIGSNSKGDSPPDASEAVSCEACHGPAGDWVTKDKHGEIGDDPAKMAAAVGLGMIDLRKADVREANCRGCHVKDTSQRPCYRASEKPFDIKREDQFKHWRDSIKPI